MELGERRRTPGSRPRRATAASSTFSSSVSPSSPGSSATDSSIERLVATLGVGEEVEAERVDLLLLGLDAGADRAPEVRKDPTDELARAGRSVLQPRLGLSAVEGKVAAFVLFGRRANW